MLHRLVRIGWVAGKGKGRAGDGEEEEGEKEVDDLILRVFPRRES